jgi:hypothetical protein
MEFKTDVNQEEIVEAIVSLFIKKIGHEQFKNEVVNKLVKEIKSDIIGSQDVQDKIKTAVKKATITVKDRINQKSEEVLKQKVDEFMNKKFALVPLDK